MIGPFLQGSTQALDISVQQEAQNGSIAGTLFISSSRSAALNGSVQSNGSIHFTTDPVTVFYTTCIYTFDGQVSTNGFGKTEMQGNFTSQYVATGGTGASGTWHVVAS